MLRQLDVSPAELWFDARVFADSLLQLRSQYSFDGILVSLHGHDPDWRSRVRSRCSTEDGEEVVWKNGDTTLCKKDDLPQFVPGIDVQPPVFSTFSAVKLPHVLNYIPVSQGLHFSIDPDHPFDIFSDITTRTGGEFSIHGEITSPFDYFLDLFGHEEGLMGLIDDPEKCKGILQHFARLVKHLALEMCETGIDAIKLSSPFAGSGFLSPAFYAEFVLPYEAEIISAVRKRGIRIYLHTCGAIGDRLELMLRTGASGLECLDPPPLGDIDLEGAFRILHGRAFIKGNIDSVNTLLAGTSEEILADARHRLNIASQRMGFILSTACSIAPTVPAKNILLIKEAVEKWG